MSDDTYERARKALHQTAETIAKDVSNTYPGMPTDYDMYVQKIGPTCYGLVDMGDVGAWAFEWYGGKWLSINHDPHTLRHRILVERGYGEGS